MKKFIFAAVICVLVFLLKATSTSTSSDMQNLRVVPLSHAQWQSVKDQVNTNGYCYIKEQNVVLVITNGCPSIENFLPIWNNIPEADLKRNKLHMKGKRGKKSPHVESMPYVGQGIIQ